ncbi:MAG: DUF1549 domain-containing protein [Planctomycetota bacterium]|nr:DUF1549 domain-containing protein [Planctomycetota bacterium]
MKLSVFLRRAAWGVPVFVIAAAGLLTPAAADPDPSVDRLQVKRAAARIDALAERALRDHHLTPNGLADDATWARRTYLAIVGRIPTADEVRAYVRSKASDKSYELVDELLASRGHESHLFNWWADLLRTRSRMPRRVSGEPYIHWLKEAIANNRPYDEMVHELLTANGAVHERGNGATGYLMRDRNMPEDNMSNTIRLFLGSRVECAQCHNHPFDKWTQKQYFEMVAFTGGVRYAKNPRRDRRVQQLSKQAQDKWGRNGIRALRRTLEPMFVGIYGSGTGAARLPKDYQYEDAKPQDWVTAAPLFDPHVSLDTNLPDPSDLPRRIRNNPRRMKKALRRMRPGAIDSREAFAGWMISPQNERFATVIANRTWKRAFGRGLIEPIDDIKDDTKPVAPELMSYLGELMLELDYDLREFERTVYYSRLWRREAVVPADVPGNIADLRGPLLRRMTAEQAWDSLLTLVVEDLDDKLASPLTPRAEYVYNEYHKLATASDEEIMERTGRLVLRYTDPEEFRKQRRRQQQERRAEMQAKRRQARDLYRAFKRAERAGDEARLKKITEELRERGLQPPGSGAGRALRDLQRASDLQSPAPDGHLLRELGQSKRDLIEAGHSDPTVPQVLALLNSFLEQRLLTNRQALLTRSLNEARGGKQAVRTAFWAVLGRSPTDAERRMWQKDVARSRNAVQDLVWTLVNAHEFLFIQ